MTVTLPFATRQCVAGQADRSLAVALVGEYEREGIQRGNPHARVQPDAGAGTGFRRVHNGKRTLQMTPRTTEITTPTGQDAEQVERASDPDCVSNAFGELEGLVRESLGGNRVARAVSDGASVGQDPRADRGVEGGGQGSRQVAVRPLPVPTTSVDEALVVLERRLALWPS